MKHLTYNVKTFDVNLSSIQTVTNKVIIEKIYTFYTTNASFFLPISTNLCINTFLNKQHNENILIKFQGYESGVIFELRYIAVL